MQFGVLALCQIRQLLKVGKFLLSVNMIELHTYNNEFNYRLNSVSMKYNYFISDEGIKDAGAIL